VVLPVVVLLLSKATAWQQLGYSNHGEEEENEEAKWPCLAYLALI